MRTATEIGRDLRGLRELRGATQNAVAAWAETHQPVVSAWENGAQTDLLPRHALGLLGALGPGLWEIAGDACLLAIENEANREALTPLVRALTAAMAALSEEGRDLSDTEERPTWRLRRMPTCEEVAIQLGRPLTPGPLGAIEGLSLQNLIELSGFLRGWSEGIQPDWMREDKIKRLRAEIERLSK